MTSGIIAEYNPFHNGHVHHIEQTKKITESKYTVAVMSGNYVQRGEPAICDKYTRAKAALQNGIDIVIELPLYYATGGADVFSYGAIDTLNKTGIIDSVCFGSEEGDMEKLQSAAKLLTNENQSFKKALKENLKSGYNYPYSRMKALETELKKDYSLLEKPNNILALEYLKALINLKSSITPYTIKRKSAEFHSKDISGKISSATAVRNAVLNQDYDIIKQCIPENYFDLLYEAVKTNVPVLDDYSSIIRYIIINTAPEKLAEISDITEGLENRIIKYSYSKTITDLIKNLKTKRYTYTKLQRAMLHIILDIQKSDIKELTSEKGTPYIRVLGFKKTASNLLSELVSKSKVPVIINLKNANNVLDSYAKKILEAEIKSTDIYYLNCNLDTNYEYRQPVVIV